MASTKIINVLRTDNFDDILGLFKESETSEVVFVLPKKAKSFSKEDHFLKLLEESTKTGKRASFLSQSPEVNQLALKYNFHVLSPKSPKKKGIPERIPNPIMPEVQANLARYNDSEDEENISIDLGHGIIDDKDDDLIDDLDEESNTKSRKDTPAGELDDEIEKDIESDEVPLDELEKAEEVKEDDEESEGLVLPEEVDYSKDLEELEQVSSHTNQNNNFEIVTASKMNRTMADILRPVDSEAINLKINKKVDKSSNISIQKNSTNTGNINQKTLDEIKKVWQTKSEIWSHSKNKVGDSSGPKFSYLSGNTVNQKNISKTLIGFFSFSAFIVLAIVVYMAIGKAIVTIKPQSQNVEFNLPVLISDKASAIDSEKNIIPGQLFSISKKIESNYPITGEKDVVQKAKGKITVYNEMTNSSQTLISTTRFESETGLIYRTLQPITIPVAKIVGGTTMPGKAEVEIIADKAGDLYNIPAGKFTVPAFKEKNDSLRFEKVYAESEQPIKGGMVGKSKVVTENDYTVSKADIETKAIQGAKEDVTAQSGDLSVVTIGEPTLKSFESSAKIDEATTDLTMTVTADLKAMGFNEADLLALINEYLKKTNNLETFKNKIEIKTSDAQFDETKEALKVTVSVAGMAYSKIDSEKIMDDLVGKSKEEIKTYINSIPGIASAKVVLNPFWVRKVPKDRSKTKIEVTYE